MTVAVPVDLEWDRRPGEGKRAYATRVLKQREEQASSAPLEVLIELRDSLLENPSAVGLEKVAVLNAEIRKRERAGLTTLGKWTLATWTESVVRRDRRPKEPLVFGQRRIRP